MRSPSGDSTGSWSVPMPDVTWVTSLPSRFIVWIAKSPGRSLEKTMRSRSPDQSASWVWR